MVPQWNPAGICSVSTDTDAFIKTIRPKVNPALTDIEGIFVAGVAAGPKDIVDTIAEAGAAAMEASNYLNELQKNEDRQQTTEDREQKTEDRILKTEDRQQKTDDIQSAVVG
jgi:heterodisulfide reductase subunit A-like polyferredoxin